MDARRPCPDSALLAAFLDGTLADYERTAVVSHLAECAECRAVALTVVEFREVEALDTLWEGDAPPPLPESLVATGVARWTREKTRAPALAIAAVAALTAIAVPVFLSLQVVAPAGSPHQAVSSLIDTAQPQRPVIARVTGADTYAPPPGDTAPSAVDHPARLRLITTASDIRSAYAHDYTAPSRRAIGVAALLTGDLEEAVATLEIAAAGAPGDLNIANDLAAAYYERSQRANRPGDLPAALSAVERVLQHEPANLAALFNRALVITALGLRAEAEAAWQAYITRDPRSPWTAEARERMQAVALETPAHEWPSLHAALDSSVVSAAMAETAVRLHASATRDYVEDDLTKRLITALKREDRAAEIAVLGRLQPLADAFARIAGDRLYGDFLLACERARQTHGLAAFVAAHEQFFDGMTLMAGFEFAKALPVLERAYADLRAVRSPMAPRAGIEIAASLYFLMRYDEAASRLTALRELLRDRSHAILAIRSAWLSGIVAFALTDFAASQAAYEQMLAAAAGSGDVDQWVMANVLLASLHDMRGDADLAWQHRIAAARRLDDVHGASVVPSFLGSASGDMVASERYAAALLFQSMLFRHDNVPPSMEVQVRAQRARALLRTGRAAEARSELRAARERVSAIASATSKLVVEADVLSVEADVYLDTDRPRAVAAIERLLELPLLRRDHVRRARAYLQRANAHVRDGHVEAATAAVERGFVALERFRQTPASELAVRSSDPVWGLYSTAAQLALRRGDVADAFAYAERRRMQATQVRAGWPGSLGSLPDLQAALPPNAALVAVTQFEERAQIFVVRAESVVTHSTPMTPSRAASLVATQLYEMVSGAPSPVTSGALFDALWRPVQSALRGAETLIVVADAPYHRLAFAGLWDRGRNRYVVEDHAVAMAPSATAVVEARRRLQQATPTFDRAAFVMGAAEAASGAALKPEALGSIYGRARVTRTPAATRAAFVAQVASADVIHVAAPVRANDQFPVLSHMQLTDEPGVRHSGVVFARDVASASRMRARLVALESGPGGPISERTEGTFGLATALVTAGVANVVSPITDFEPTRIEETWVRFHTHYSSGTTASESLRLAQVAALRESNRRPGPWATLTVFGAAQ